MMDELLQKIQREGDQNAFKQLYQSLFFRLYQFAFSYVRSRESAEEVVNDVFLSLWQKRKELDSLSNFNVYLYVAVKNASLNLLRRNKISTPLSVDDLVVDHLHLSANPESLLISAELRAAIQAAIEKLPPRCKIIFKLIKEDHLSYREVGAILDISVKTVDAQLCLALKKLSVSLQSLWKEYQSVLATL
jgi:RNA polymerase sigma-70 factor (ECF subfamily)